MVVKVYVSEYSGNFEVKKHQQRVETVLESACVRHQLVDVCAPEHLQQRLFMQDTARTAPGERHPLPPQIYNEEYYCGDFYDFDYANDTGQLLQFLRLEEGDVELPARQALPAPPPEPVSAPQAVTVEPAEEEPLETPLLEPPSPAPEPETEPEPPRRPPEEPWQIDRSGGECLNVDKEA